MWWWLVVAMLVAVSFVVVVLVAVGGGEVDPQMSLTPSCVLSISTARCLPRRCSQQNKVQLSHRQGPPRSTSSETSIR
jgi:hypothetical protein